MKGLGRSLQHEIAQVCSDNTVLILRDKAESTLKEFMWEKLLEEVKVLAPTLLKDPSKLH